MPADVRTTRRYRGKEIILLRRLTKVVLEIQAHNNKYPPVDRFGRPVRRNLKFTETEMSQLNSLSIAAAIYRVDRWPPEA